MYYFFFNSTLDTFSTISVILFEIIFIQIILNSILGSSEQLTERLREVGDRLRLPLTARPGPLVPSIPGTSGSVTASQIEVGPSHFAFLLSDGRLCRLPFSVISDRLDLNKTSQSASGTGSGTGGSLGSGHGSSKGSGSKSSSHASLSTGIIQINLTKKK